MLVQGASQTFRSRFLTHRPEPTYAGTRVDERNRHQIDSRCPGLETLGKSTDGVGLFVGESFLGQEMIVPDRHCGLHLYCDAPPVIVREDVDLTATGPDVAIDDHQTVPLHKVGGYPLAEYSDFRSRQI